MQNNQVKCFHKSIQQNTRPISNEKPSKLNLLWLLNDRLYKIVVSANLQWIWREHFWNPTLHWINWWIQAMSSNVVRRMYQSNEKNRSWKIYSGFNRWDNRFGTKMCCKLCFLGKIDWCYLFASKVLEVTNSSTITSMNDKDKFKIKYFGYFFVNNK